MNDDRIVDALRNRPSDEPLYERPLRRLPGHEPGEAEFIAPLVPSLGVGSGHPTIRTRTPIRALPALALIVLVGVAIWALGFASGRQPAASPSDGRPHLSTHGSSRLFWPGAWLGSDPGRPSQRLPEHGGAAGWLRCRDVDARYDGPVLGGRQRHPRVRGRDCLPRFRSRGRADRPERSVRERPGRHHASGPEPDWTTDLSRSVADLLCRGARSGPGR